MGTSTLPAVIVGFETGFDEGETTFIADGANFAFDTYLIVTQFATFGSGGGNWFVDSGFGEPRTGSLGAMSITSPGMAFYFTGVDLWTSNNAGNNYATGSVTIVGTLTDSSTVSTTLTVAPTGNAGLDWDTTNDLSAFSGLALTSVEFILGPGINYLAIDNIGLETVMIPEPSTTLLLTAFAAFPLLRRRR